MLLLEKVNQRWQLSQLDAINYPLMRCNVISLSIVPIYVRCSITMRGLTLPRMGVSISGRYGQVTSWGGTPPSWYVRSSSLTMGRSAARWRTLRTSMATRGRWNWPWSPQVSVCLLWSVQGCWVKIYCSRVCCPIFGLRLWKPHSNLYKTNLAHLSFIQSSSSLLTVGTSWHCNGIICLLLIHLKKS